MFFACPGILCQVQTRLSRIIHLQEITDFIVMSRFDMVELPLLGFLDVLEQASRRYSLQMSQVSPQKLDILRYF